MILGYIRLKYINGRQSSIESLTKLTLASQTEGSMHWSRSPELRVADMDNSYQDQIQELRGLVLRMASSFEESKKNEKERKNTEDDEISNKSLITLH